LATAGRFQKNHGLQYKQQDEYHHLPSLKQQRYHCTWTTIVRSLKLSLPTDDPTVERVHPLLASRQCRLLAALATAGNFEQNHSLQYKQGNSGKSLVFLPWGTLSTVQILGHKKGQTKHCIFDIHIIFFTNHFLTFPNSVSSPKLIISQ
jgi:hypothetical protein